MRAAILKHMTDEWQSTSELSDKSDISPRSLIRPLDELHALGLVDKMSRDSAGEVDRDGRTNHYCVSFK